MDENKCKCGKEGQEEQSCPYAWEIQGEDEPCNCCDECRDQCWDDI